MAQVTPENVNQEDLQRNNQGNFLMKSFNVGYEGVRGTPFLYDDWEEGSIIMLNGDSMKNQEMKLDIFEDQLIVLSKRSGEAMIPMQQVIRSFSMPDSLGNMHFFLNTLPYEVEEEIERKGFFEVIYDGNNKLLVKHRKQFVEADYEGAYNSGRRYDEFRYVTNKYYLLKSDDTFIELKRGKKGVLKSLNDDGSLEKIVKQEKLDLKTEEDLIKLIEIYSVKESG